MGRVGVFASPDEAREFKQLLLQLRASGFALQGGQKRQPVIEAPESIVVFNSSGEAIPAFAVMQCIGSDDDVIEVDKPADCYGVNGPYLINGPNEIATDSRGVGKTFGAVVVNNTDATTLEIGDRLAPAEDEWFAEPNPAGNMIYLGKSKLRDPSTELDYVLFGEYPQVIHAKTDASGIDAATGSTTRTLGSGLCTVFKSDADGVITETEVELIAYNFSGTAVQPSVFVMASRNEKGLWVVVAEDCTP